MGLTAFASGRHAAAADKKMRENENEIIVALAGNPNVGKSTVFNAPWGEIPPSGAFFLLRRLHDVHSLQIIRHARQRPFSLRFLHSSKEKLPELQNFLDDSEDGLDHAFALPVLRSSLGRFQPGLHALHRVVHSTPETFVHSRA